MPFIYPIYSKSPLNKNNNSIFFSKSPLECYKHESGFSYK